LGAEANRALRREGRERKNITTREVKRERPSQKEKVQK